MREEFLWVEKYRPRTIDECILTDELKGTFSQFVDNKEIPNLLLSGTSGIGKTTVARALCEQLETDYILINGSEESGIGVLRTKILDFASTVSLSGNTKVIILDEADEMLSSGFKDQVYDIFQYLPSTKLHLHYFLLFLVFQS